MIYLIVSFLIDLLFSYSDISFSITSLFFPLMFISCIPISYCLFEDRRKFFLIICLFAIIYDLLFSDIVFINLIYVIFFGFIVSIFFDAFKVNFFNVLFLSILSFVFYDFYVCLIINLTGYNSFSFTSLVSKQGHSFLINFIYILLSIYVFKGRIFCYRRSVF